MSELVFRLQSTSPFARSQCIRYHQPPERLSSGQITPYDLQPPQTSLSTTPLSPPPPPSLGPPSHRPPLRELPVNQPTRRKRGRPPKSSIAAQDKENSTTTLEIPPVTRPTKRLRNVRDYEEARDIREIETLSQQYTRRQNETHDRAQRARNRNIGRGDPVGSSPYTPDPRRFIYCFQCNIPKAPAQFPSLQSYGDVCNACLTEDHTNELQYCLRCFREKTLDSFVNRGHRETRCLKCRLLQTSRTAPPQPSHLQDFAARIELGDLQQPAVSDSHWHLIRLFYEKLSKCERQTCDCCNEIGFDLKLNNLNYCSRCQSDDETIHLYSDDNNMDPHPLPPDLPPLSEAAESLIARVHVTMSLGRVKGQQFKYRGHICNFMNNTQKLAERLPRLPQELDILLLKPASISTGDPAVRRAFSQQYRVRRRDIEKWLRFLIAHHPDYENLTIDEENLARLPEDDSIIHELPVAVVDEDFPTDSDVGLPPDAGAADDAVEDALIDESCVPDLQADQTELEAIQEAIHRHQPPASFPMASIRPTPIDERDQSIHIARMAFPTLFPHGHASFNIPRLRHVSFIDWARHLLRYKDGRFARHSMFRFWVFNTNMRATAREASSFFVNGSEHQDIDIDRLRDLASDPNGRIHDVIARRAGGLLGTRPYWNTKRSNLQAMAKSLPKPPSLFFTLSSADHQWADLFKHFPNREEYFAAPEASRYNVAWQLVQKHPHIVADYLERRFSLFFKDVLCRVYNVTDHWHRFEWQARGSGHIHGFLWIDGCPVVDDLEPFLEFWGYRVVALHPDGDLPPAAVHPSSRLWGDRSNTMHELAEHLNRYQRHTICSTSYCLRRNRQTRQEHCRFHFPWPLSTAPAVGRNAELRFRTYEPARNHPLLCKYDPSITMAWMANTDASPCTDLQAVVAYLAKYCSKAEKKSARYIDIGKDLLPNLSARNPFHSFTNKFMNKMIAERDWSAQEVCHILLDKPLCGSSRDVRPLDVRPFSEQQQQIELGDGSGDVRMTILERYCSRPADLEHVTYLGIMQDCTIKKDSFRKRRDRHRVARIIPDYSPCKQYTEYCRAKIILHHPFRELDFSDVYNSDFDGLGEPSWEAAYDYCQRHHPPHPLDTLRELPSHEESDTESIHHPNSDDDFMQDDGEVLANRRPGYDGEEVALGSELGLRHIDISFDWLARRYEVDIALIKAEVVRITRSAERHFIVPISLEDAGDSSILNAEQRDVFETVIDHCLSPTAPEPLRMHLNGVAGTGKSKIIDLITNHLAFYARKPVVLRAAPTGVAAHNIGGSTLHQLLRISVNRDFEPLNHERLAALQDTFRDCRLLIIDEKSMIGLRFLSWLDQRLRQLQAKPESPFGGLNLLFCGDFGQLAPVMDTPLYQPLHTTSSDAHRIGKLAYASFACTKTLTQIIRQQGTSPQDMQFRDLLDQLREGPISVRNWFFLCQRIKGNGVVSEDEWSSFNDALRIYATKARVYEYNIRRLEQLQKPVLRIQARNSCSRAKEASSDVAGNLVNELLLCEGAKVMLCWNLCTQQGLVNGSIGTVHSILWEDGTTDVKTMPAAVMVDFGYTGPASIVIAGTHVVPVLPRNATWDAASVTCTRTQFPLCLAFAITVHKSQGLTMDRVVLNLSCSDFTPALTYVAISRVRSVTGIIVEEPFSYDRFPKEVSMTIRQRIDDQRYRRGQPPRTWPAVLQLRSDQPQDAVARGNIQRGRRRGRGRGRRTGRGRGQS